MKILFWLTTIFSIATISQPSQAQIITRTVTTTTTIPAIAPQPYCREYTETFSIGGQTQQGFGTACLQPDGSWEIQPRTRNTNLGTAGITTTTTTTRYITRNNRVYFVPTHPFVVPIASAQDRYHHHRYRY